MTQNYADGTNSGSLYLFKAIYIYFWYANFIDNSFQMKFHWQFYNIKYRTKQGTGFKTGFNRKPDDDFKSVLVTDISWSSTKPFAFENEVLLLKTESSGIF